MKSRQIRLLLLLFLFILLGVILYFMSKLDIPRGDYSSFQNVSPTASRFPANLPATVFVIGTSPSLQQTPDPSPVLSPAAPFVIEPIMTATPFGLPRGDSLTRIRTSIQAPPGLQSEPFITLWAFESLPEIKLEMRGSENLREFICTGSPCKLPLTESSTIRFIAYNASGDQSPEVYAHVTVERREGGYSIVVDSTSQFSLFQDSCSTIWKTIYTGGDSWSRFPQSPFELNSNKILHLLSSRLIINSVVDAKDCPNGGLGIGSEYPTGCGVERANDKMVEWQNQYDFQIWLTSLEIGIPPKLLKSLIEYETQYWPSNERFYLDEIGLGQINQLGIDVLLRQDPQFYGRICSTVYSDCSLPYLSLDPAVQAVIRGAVMSSIDATCTTCTAGINIAKANQSIPIIAQLLKANCQMVGYLDLQRDPLVEYEDLWKFTMATYHSGYSCVQDAARLAKNKKESLTWDALSPNFACDGAKSYVDGFWDTLASFDKYSINPASVNLLQVAPTFVPTPTPIPQVRDAPSKALVWARVYLDANGNGQPDKTELLDGIYVELTLETGVKLSGVTRNGEVVFDMNGYSTGTNAVISLPGLYREKLFSLPAAGLVQFDFVFTAPEIPKELP